MIVTHKILWVFVLQMMCVDR